MVLGSLQVDVSGAEDNFLQKYGDRAARINLCRYRDSSAAATAMSDVLG
jgi:hypothetical protein